MLAAAMSRLAGRMVSLTLVLFALAHFSSPTLAGWLTFAAVAPGLAISPVAGAVLDRVGPTMAVRIDLIASAVFITMVSLTGRFGPANPTIVFALVILFSLTGPLGASGVRILLARLVPSAALDRANALDTVSFALVDVVGPGLAGVTASVFGPDVAMVLIAVSYAVAALGMVRVPRAPRPARARDLLWRQTLEGIAAVARQPTLRSLAVSYSLYQVTWGALVVVVPVIAADRFAAGTSSAVAGCVWAAMGIAGGAAALLAGHLRTAGRERPVMAAGMIVTALGVWPVAAVFGFGGLAVGLLLVGAASGPIDVALLTLRQRRTDPRQLGRVLSISLGLNMAGFPLGSAIAGMLITSSLSATFLLAGLASAIAAVATAAIPGDAGRQG